MKKYVLFDKQINIRDYHCLKNNSNEKYEADPYVNIYVRLRNNCNAKCKFCEFTSQKENFNLYKFESKLKSISKRIRINKLSFTGGEPTLNTDLLNECLNYVKYLNKDIFTVINTNGFNISNIDFNRVNSIALSRHHYDDKINNEILGFNALSAEQLKRFKRKGILHLSCNLQKDYIGSEEEVIKYLEFSDSINVTDVGFVSLMKVNDFCKEQHIDFSNLNLNSKYLYNNKTWNNFGNCKCANYLYAGQSGNIVKAYARYYCNNKEAISQLVYDGEYFREGFNGQIII